MSHARACVWWWVRAASRDVHTQLAREGRLCDLRCAKWAAHAGLRTDPISRVHGTQRLRSGE